MKKPMTAERLERLASGPWSYLGYPGEVLKQPERSLLMIHGSDLFDLIEALRIAREALAWAADAYDSTVAADALAEMEMRDS